MTSTEDGCKQGVNTFPPDADTKALLIQCDDTSIVMKPRYSFSAEDRYIKTVDRMKVELYLLIITHDQLL